MIRVINEPIDVTRGNPFVVSVKIFITEPDDFTIIFETREKQLFLVNELGEKTNKIEKRFEHNGYGCVQSVQTELIIDGDISRFPYWTIVDIYTYEDIKPSICEIIIHS